MDGAGQLRVLLVGATGLVGQGGALACQRSPKVAALTALVQAAGGLKGVGSERVVPDFLRIDARTDDLAGFDACFYCAAPRRSGRPKTSIGR